GLVAKVESGRRRGRCPIGPAGQTTNVVGRVQSDLMVRRTPSARDPQDGSCLARAALRARFTRRHACPRASPEARLMLPARELELELELGLELELELELGSPRSTSTSTSSSPSQALRQASTV